ncbi:MAG: HlyD family type I secretion periplasmic adaptor subunit [Rhodobacterales bacterium]|nr:HlyD family type I secretion periplasmic adaptor subunit [Rhodobacterales bacterium]
MTDTRKRWSARGSLIAGFLTVLVLVGGLGVWGMFAEISGAVIAPGRIEVDQNRQVVQHPDGGVVAEIMVKEGDTVAVGDLLIKLDPTELQSQLAVVEGQLFEVLARRARFEAERDGTTTLAFDPLLTGATDEVAAELMDGQQKLFEARLDSALQEKNQLGKRRDQIGNQIDGIRAQQDALTTQLGLIGQELADQQSLLDRGLAQSTRVLALEREQANLTGQVGELTATAAEAESRITETDIQILQIETTRREEAITRLRDLQFNEIELAEKRRSLLTQRDRLDIRAPVSGIVYGMTVFAPRSVIRPADPVLFLIPQDRPMVITTQVEPIHTDEIFVGQEVGVRFSAFNQRMTPELRGKVVQISADAFQDQQSRISYYRAEVELLPGEKEKLPEGLTLIPGMPVETFLATDARTPFQYLMRPLSNYFTKSFREN